LKIRPRAFQRWPRAVTDCYQVLDTPDCPVLEPGLRDA
jgi:hypothetical protein